MHVNVGVVGCGNISEIYIDNLQNRFSSTAVVAVVDLERSRAVARAEQFGIAVVCESVDEMLSRRDVDIILNLTIPAQHAAVSREALLAGKHVYSEKPMATTTDQGDDLLQLARSRGLHLAVAPDTVLGAATQTARWAIESGLIGTPFGFVGHLLTSGAASWHPNPEFLYSETGGPILDYAPYPVADLVYLLGSVERVAAFGSRPFTELQIGSGPRAGEWFPVSVDTFTAATFEFQGGVTGTLAVSMSVSGTGLGGPHQNSQGIEIYGTEGTLILPPSSHHGGEVLHRSAGASDWNPVPLRFPHSDNARGLGVADLAEAILARREPQISTAFCYHVCEVLLGLVLANESHQSVAMKSVAPSTRTAPAIATSDAQ